MIRQYPPREVRRELWPWLKERRYATSREDELLEVFLGVPGRRPVHLRPGLRLIRRWDADAVRVLARLGELAGAVRREVNIVLLSADEPALSPASRSVPAGTNPPRVWLRRRATA